MYYKELIERLRASNRDALVSSDEVATAIETLLAELDKAREQLQDLQAQVFQKAEERDAAVEDLKGQCGKCKLFNCQ